jgi:regulator of cell morphogenesis and NO signaling
MHVGDREVGQIVLATPTVAGLFDRLGIDYCCHGDRSLGEACAAGGLDVATVAAAVEAFEQPTGALVEPHRSLAELANHIEARHHHYLRQELPSLLALADKVLAVHGDRHPELYEVHDLTHALAEGVLAHLDAEERDLFPKVRRIIAGHADATLASPMDDMRSDHDNAGQKLAALRACTGGYDVPEDACASFRSLYERLTILEWDTHQHIHLENNLLFPWVLGLVGQDAH